jgi:putative transposase
MNLGISWKNTKENPKIDPLMVAETQKSIRTKLNRRIQEIHEGKVVVLMIDECHLHWGDVCGYIGGQKNQLITIPVINDKQRQGIMVP